MPKVTFIAPGGKETTVDDAEGTLMSIAVANQVEGIDGDCGGVCACATCHVYVDPQWVEQVGPMTENETGMLEFDDNLRDNSRLGCQVTMSPELDGLVVRVADR